jgi:Bacterial extracellular solute-binding proteins, family 3
MDPVRRHHHHRDMGGGSTASASVSSTSHSNPNNNNGNNPTFKLNAPQATDDDVEDSGLLLGTDENIYATNQAMIDQYYESPEIMEYHQQQQQLQQHQVSTNRSVNSGGSGSNKQNKKVSNSKSVDKMAAFNDMDEEDDTQPEPRQKALPLRCMIACGTVAIFLLVGLIVAVAVALSRRGPGGSGNSSSSNNNNNNGVPTLPPMQGGPLPTVPPGTPSMPTAPTTPGTTPTAPTVPPPPTAPPATLDPTSTLGRISAAGTLKCGVPVDQPGFALVNTTTQRMEGFDSDLCRAVAAAIFGSSDGHVEFQPLTAFERFPALAAGEVDMLARTTTHTMERSIKEVCVCVCVCVCFKCVPYVHLCMCSSGWFVRFCLLVRMYKCGGLSFHRRDGSI